MNEPTFECFKCNKQSSFKHYVDDGIKRALPEPGPKILKFHCEHCGKTNEITISHEEIKIILSKYFRDGGSLDGLIDRFLR